MNRFFRYAALALALAVGMPALAADDSEEDSSHLGVRAQYDLTWSTRASDLVHAGSGGSIGMAYYVPFGKLTYFNVRLMFLYNTFRYDGDIDIKYSPLHYDGWLKMIGMRVPLNIGFKLYQRPKLRFSLYTGPTFFANFKFEGDYTIKYLRGHRDDEKVKHKLPNSGMEIGWTFGTAVDIKKHWHAYFEYTIGCSDMGSNFHNDEPGFRQFRRSEVAIGVGYNF